MKAFQAITIDGLTAKNRIVRSATNDHLGNPDGSVSDAQIDMYDALASNNIGTIITGHMSVSPDLGLRADAMQTAIGNDSCIAGLRRIADKIHQYGAVAVAQLSMAGPRGLNPFDFNTLAKDELIEIRDNFVAAARRAGTAGFDAVQIHGAHWYLLAAMLNSDLNKRTDEYGGDNTGRVRLIRQIVEEIKQEHGENLPVFVKLNAHNTLDGVDDEDMLVEYSRILHDAGVSLVEVSGMSFAKMPRNAECYFIDAAKRLKEEIPSLSVSLVGGIFSRETIERTLGAVDMASLARTLLTQPDFITKMRGGELDKSRCIRCNKCFEIFATKYERCIFGPVNTKLEENFRKSGYEGVNEQ